jgi:uncharacterized membrane protein YbhN (UPF0104 family)
MTPGGYEAEAAAVAAGPFRRSLPFVRSGAQFLFAAGLLALLLWRTDIGAVRDEFRNADLWWLAPAFFFNIASDWFRAIRWREFFRPMRVVGVPFLFGVSVLGVACNLALPLRAGELLRFQVLRRRTGLESPQVIATMLSEKLMDIVAFSSFLVVGFVFFEESRFLWPVAVIYAVLLCSGIVGARWLASHGARARGDGGLEWQPDGRVRAWVVAMGRSLGRGLQTYRSVRALAIVIAASLAAWLCEAVLYFSCGQALGIDVNPAVYLLVVVAATIAVSVPLTQAGLGVFEVAVTGLLVAFGVDEAQAAAFAIFSHVMLALPYFVSGPIAAIALRLSPADIAFLRSQGAISEQSPAVVPGGE